jgi:hypothetical protein
MLALRLYRRLEVPVNAPESVTAWIVRVLNHPVDKPLPDAAKYGQ